MLHPKFVYSPMLCTYVQTSICTLILWIHPAKISKIDMEEANNQISKVTGLKHFDYDRSQPFIDSIPFYSSYKVTEWVDVPKYYILPQAYKRVIKRLILNKIEFATFKNDTIIEVKVDYIDQFSNAGQPSNGHYFHSKVITRNETQQVKYYAGDLIIPVQQKGIKYLIEMLEPKAKDSFFRWNFFDNILDRREYFSSYGFEENALKYLNEHPRFNKQFQEKRKTDKEFANNHRAQLSYIYYNTEWAEKTYKRYPVAKVF